MFRYFPANFREKPFQLTLLSWLLDENIILNILKNLFTYNRELSKGVRQLYY